MNIKQLAVIMPLTLMVNTGWAQAYQTEVTGSFKRHTSDYDVDTDFKSVSGQWFFEKVDNSRHPLAEAAFLERASSISFAYETVDAWMGANQETNGIFGFQQRGTVEILTGKIEHYVPDTMLYVGAMYNYRRLDTYGYDMPSDNDWGATIGLVPINGLLILTEYWDEAGYDPNIQAQYVVKLSEENAIRLEAGYHDVDVGDDRVTIGGDYYFDRTWSVGGWIENSFDTGVGLRTRKFFTDTFSVTADYYELDSYKSYGISASLRF